MSERSIPFTTQTVEGIRLQGFEAHCSKRGCTHKQFIPSAKKLPEDAVANKFRQKGWFIMSGENICPTCSSGKRGKSSVRDVVVPIKPQLKPHDKLSITGGNASVVIERCGIARPAVSTLLETKDPHQRKFKFTFNKTTLNALQIDKLMLAFEDHFDVEVKNFFFEPSLSQTYDENTGHLSVKLGLDLRVIMALKQGVKRNEA